MGRFTEGQELQSISWGDGGVFQVGSNGVTKIVVVMEFSQMGLVPWFEVWKEDTPVHKFNGALVEGVEYAT